MLTSLTGPHSLSGETVKIIVGTNPSVTFSVEENLICAASDYFKRAMSKGWIEAQQRTVRLEEDSPNIFRIYLHWLYRGTIPAESAAGIEHYSEFLDHEWSEWMQLAKAYVLGDTLQDGDFADAVIDAMIEKSGQGASVDGLSPAEMT
jgi:hypothetical protein